MSNPLTQDLHDQFQRTAAMIRGLITEFDDSQWRAGISNFLIPAKLSFHLIESLEFYFTQPEGGEENYRFPFGRRFGQPWWKTPDQELPSQENLLAYLEEIETLIAETFAEMDDEALHAPFEYLDFSGKTWTGHLAYALRHTMHHQGQLSALSIHHGHEGGDWA